MKDQSEQMPHCGYVAIVGRPNVGKSTLLNHMIGQKLSITSRKPQTTRHTLLGIKTEENAQIIFVDTPGMHKSNANKAVNRHMNRAAKSVLDDVDVILFLVERLQWEDEDRWIAEMLQRATVPVLLLVNKVDQIEQKDRLLPYIQTIQQEFSFHSYMPIVALTGEYLPQLEQEIVKLLPKSEFFFPEDQITDKSERFLAGEIVREKITRQLGKELPYEVAVEVEEFSRDKKILTVGAVIYVERDGQKAIIIGKGGDRLRKLGTEARIDMERLFDEKVMLRLWVKVKHGWSSDARALKSFGIDS